MKKILWMIAACLLTSNLMLAQTQFHAEPTMTLEAEVPAPTAIWEEEVIDLGKIPQGTPASVVFEFTNHGNSPIELTTVKPSCGCTAADYSKEPVLAGETGYVKAIYNASSVGFFHKTITVRSNAKEGVKLLKIKGEVIKTTE